LEEQKYKLAGFAHPLNPSPKETFYSRFLPFNKMPFFALLVHLGLEKSAGPFPFLPVFGAGHFSERRIHP